MAIDLNNPVFGIDLSHHNVVDFEELSTVKNLSWCYCKASEGMTYQDPKFEIYVKSLMEIGVPVGAYHFARPDNNSAIQDASNFLKTLQKVGGQESLSLRPCLDMEVGAKAAKKGMTAQQGMDWIQGWIDYVYQETGQETTYYGGPNAWFSLKMPKTWHPERAIFWRAKYPNNKTQYLNMSTQAIQLYKAGKYEIDYFPNWPTRLWQYSGYGSVTGVKNRCDLNLTDTEGFAAISTDSSMAIAGGAGVAIAVVAGAAIYLSTRGKQ
ncbi:GH25 family lysozyme [uncultured Limnobacter sp.]|uniref:glycoside hydrolase family 25 protein n=1 Tax=uncultured Limnobacter sp. TaxID=199681 RepID=UPI0032B1E30D|tara:strand:- start:229 stop:1026 length:798 start_codon:yes stop_codon:yes gene_type:complete